MVHSLSSVVRNRRSDTCTKVAFVCRASFVPVLDAVHGGAPLRDAPLAGQPPWGELDIVVMVVIYFLWEIWFP